MADPLITAQQLIDRFDRGEEDLRRFAGDDGAGSYHVGKVTEGIAVASAETYGILLAGFDTNERVQALAANDPEVLNALARLVRYHLTVFKDDFRLPDGKSVFSSDAREARDALREKARGAKRSSAEATAAVGQSALLRPRGSSGPRRSILTDASGKPVGF